MVKLFVAALFSFALAQSEEEQQMRPALRKFSYLGTMVFSQANTTHTSGDISKRIQEYGCYCFRDPKSMGVLFGAGAPVDDQDRFCRNLMQCRKCIDMDYPGQCDVDIEKYLFTIDSSTKEITCDPNQPSCRFEKCECDKQFAIEFGKVYSDDSYDEFYWLNKKNVQRRNNRGDPVFDADLNCQKGDETGPSDGCCGEVGQRMPYSQLRHDCCNNKLSNVGDC